MREQSRIEVAERLQLSKATIRLGDALVPLLRRKVLAATPSRQLSVAFALVEEVNDEAIALLGDNSEDPSRADMDAVLPPLIESQGLPTRRVDGRCVRVQRRAVPGGDGRDHATPTSGSCCPTRRRPK